MSGKRSEIKKGSLEIGEFVGRDFEGHRNKVRCVAFEPSVATFRGSLEMMSRDFSCCSSCCVTRVVEETVFLLLMKCVNEVCQREEHQQDRQER